MSPPVNRIPSDAALPVEADMVVIGGGIIGVTAAYELARKGFRVALVEKGHVAGEQSSRNWGWCRVHGRALHDLALCAASLRRWGEIDREIGLDTGFKACGIVATFKTKAEQAYWEDWLEKARPYQLDGRLMTGDEVRGFLPTAQGAGRDEWIGGVYSAMDGRAEPSKAAPAIAQAARALGVTIHQDCAARGLETTGGKVSAVVTEKGTIRTSRVLCAGGAWTSLFCRHHGISLPQAGVFATALRTEAGPQITTGGVTDGLYAARLRDDGGYTVALGSAGRVDFTPQNLRHAWKFVHLFLRRRKKLTFGIGASFLRGPEAWSHWSNNGPSPFERDRVYDPPASQALVEKALRLVRADFPAMQQAKVAEAWGGFIDSTPDARPVISAVESLPGFFLAAGFSGLGFGMGPASGRMVADLMAGDATEVDPTPYRFGRFSDGTPMRPASKIG